MRSQQIIGVEWLNLISVRDLLRRAIMMGYGLIMVVVLHIRSVLASSSLIIAILIISGVAVRNTKPFDSSDMCRSLLTWTLINPNFNHFLLVNIQHLAALLTY